MAGSIHLFWGILQGQQQCVVNTLEKTLEENCVMQLLERVSIHYLLTSLSLAKLQKTTTTACIDYHTCAIAVSAYSCIAKTDTDS